MGFFKRLFSKRPQHFGDDLTESSQFELDETTTVRERIFNHVIFPYIPERILLAAFNNWGVIFSRRYKAQGKFSDLNRALEFLEEALLRTPPDSPDLPMYLNNLGAGLRNRYDHTSQLADLEKSIHFLQAAVQHTPSDSPDLPMYLSNLGACLRARYVRTSELTNLEEAIHFLQMAVQLTPSDSPDLPMYFNNLGNSLRDRYAHTDRLADLEETIRVHRAAVQSTPPNSSDLPLYLNNLGVDLRARYARTDQLDDLEEAIHLWQESVERTPPKSTELPRHLDNLGNGLRDRYNRTSQLTDLEESIRISRTVVQITPSKSPELPRHLSNLGLSIRDRYAHTGQLADLEEAIHIFQMAVQLTDPKSSELPTLLNNLGIGLHARYNRTNHLADLEEAIRILQTAVQRTSPQSTELSRHLTNLGGSLSDRYAHTGQLADLEEAIRVYQTAVQITPPGSLELPGYLNNLGFGLSGRYDHSGQLTDLEEAIRLHETAVQITPPKSPKLPSRLNNLAGGLYARYTHTGQLTDLEEAIRVFQTVVLHTHPDSPDLARNLNNLGGGLYTRYGRTGQLADLEEAIRVYEQAMRYLDEQFLTSPVSFQLGQQGNWAGLFARAVAAHLQAGNVQDALVTAEGNKSRLLTTLLGRSHLPAPDTLAEAQISQERELAEQLNTLDALSLAQRDALEQTASPGNTLAQRQALVSQLRQLWQEMAQQGVEAREYVALRRGDRPTWDDLARLARSLPADAAILSLFITGEHILLFLLRPDASLHTTSAKLSLDDFHYIYLNNYIDEVINRPVYRRTGRPLTHRWRELGQPLLADILPHLAGVKHLIIAPQGALHLLPLHALTLDKQGCTLLDDFTISYIPALSLLDRLQRRPPITADAAVVMGYTDADPQSESGAAEREVFLGEAVQSAAQLGVSPALDEAASGAALRAAVSHRALRLLHLSCHGYFHQSDPLRSGILLADDLFTARDFMSLRFQADLVTLSACQTGISGSLGGDEMAGLSQALLYAGASSLLMGLWSVNAFTTAALMADLYRRLWGSDGRKQMSEAQALREAALALRRGELTAPNKQLDLSDPYYWASFVLVGDWR